MSKYRIGAYVPDGHTRHPRARKEKHRYGLCMNPHTGGRQDCVNNRPAPTVHCSREECTGHCDTGCQCVIICWRRRTA